MVRTRSVPSILPVLLAITALTAPAARLHAQASWEVSATPAVSLGGIDGPEVTRFDRVRSVRVLPDGRILVADRGSNQLRIFDADGGHDVSVGGEGEGPGEFLALGSAGPYRGDSIAAFDFRTSRITVFDRGGALGRSFRPTSPPGIEARTELWGATRAGAWTLAWNAARTMPGDVHRSALSIWSHDADGLPGTRHAASPGRESARSIEGDMALELVLPWGRQTIGARTGDVLAYGDNGTATIRVDSSGVARSFTVDWPTVPFTGDVLDAFIERQASAAPPEVRGRIDQLFRSVATPETLPRFDRIVVATDGSIWVRRFLVPGDDREEWAVHGVDGTRLAVVIAPPGLRIMDAGRDFVAGVWLDSFDVESVHVRPLYRGSSGR